MRTVRSVLVVAMLLPTALADAINNDAGSGIDAPNSESEMFLVPGTASVTGYLKRVDADWYRSYDASGSLACVTLATSSDITTNASLVLRDGTVRREMRVTLAPGERPMLAQSAASLTDARAGFVNTGEARGAYGFELRTFTMSNFASDANSGSDAGDGSSAPLVQPGCIGGALSLFDTSDSYRFTAAAGDVSVVTLSSAQSGLRLDVLAADGTVLGSALAGQQLAVSFPESGTYSMRASATSVGGNVPYMLALVLGPPGQGCRPVCMS